MPWRLILTLVIFIIFVIFAAFNLDNRCNISFGFKEFEQVPVFMTVFFSFVVGLICALPMVLHIRKKRENKPAKTGKKKLFEKPAEMEAYEPIEDEQVKIDALSARERFFAKRHKK
ncbi:MAG: hypothetical protein FWB77_05025 [Treponema sp.]|nr:hypothetical protein [Treponema sp.]